MRGGDSKYGQIRTGNERVRRSMTHPRVRVQSAAWSFAFFFLSCHDDAIAINIVRLL